ncbi:MAG TPA: hypothetical protein VN578_12405 [Candidatus Binatia bacterium]|jgi:hypothetical protein|nr:hypothetical protein [Candidatus Binatia bacterium]
MDEIKRLEQKVGPDQKDAWDKWQVIGTLLGSVLVPVALAVTGFHFSSTLTAQQIKSSEQMAIQQLRSSEEATTNNLRLGQYQIVAGLMKSLVSPDTNERKQAINFVFIVMHDHEDEAHQLVYRLSVSDADPAVRAYAADTLDARANELASDAFSSDQQVSQAAQTRLTNAWRGDSRVTKSVLAAVEKSATNTSSFANGVDVLAALDAGQLQQHSNDVARFIHRVPTNTSQLQRSVNLLRTKLRDRD